MLGEAMSRKTEIQLEMAKRLSARQELAIIRVAFDRRASPEMRARLSALLLLHDHFDDVIALLTDFTDLSFDELLTLALAHIARETDSDTRAAGIAADRALALADTDIKRARALALRGKTETRLGDVPAARATLREALDLNPHEKDACKRLAAIELNAGDFAAVLALTDALIARGAAHARLFAARGLAQARLGKIDTARALMDDPALRFADTLATPAGWDSIAAFNAALAGELLAHPGLRYERYGTASELTWRIDAPVTGEAPLTRVVLDQISATLSDHLDQLAASGHPWAATRPAAAMLRSWCVITESQGFETWHVHQFGWLSGSYYVRVPDSIARGTGEAGCIDFGLPGDLAGAEAAAAFGTRLVRPQEGLMLAFASHSYHRTYPHGLGEKRICLAFDLRAA